MDDLPTKYDVIVIGTGATTSIVAGALSRVGKSVLHIDENDFYGEEWASFNLEGIQSWINPPDTQPSSPTDCASFLGETDRFLGVNRRRRCWDIQQTWVADDNGDENWTKEKFLAESRKFNLDLSPRMFYSRGSLVELLISSNIARYAEFKSVTRVLTYREGRLEVVPCSRADVFATRHVSVVQKRMLVKVLKSFAEYPESSEEFAGFEDKTFVEFLKHKKLDEQLIHYIVYSIAMGSEGIKCVEGVEASRKFLHSLGRFGNTPFICSLYGSGELPQCFCRLCAVYGGVYHLNRKIDGFVIDAENKTTAVVSMNQKLEAEQFLLTSSLAPGKLLKSRPITRGIFITDKSILPADKEAITLLQFPLADPVTIMEIGSACHVCPPGLFVVHMTTMGPSLEPAENALFSPEDSPLVLWSLVWKMDCLSVEPDDLLPSNLKIVSGPDHGLDYDIAIETARKVFSEICPDEDFLPRAPDPEEIVLEPAED